MDVLDILSDGSEIHHDSVKGLLLQHPGRFHLNLLQLGPRGFGDLVNVSDDPHWQEKFSLLHVFQVSCLQIESTVLGVISAIETRFALKFGASFSFSSF